MKLNIKALALTSGILWGVGLFLVTWWIILMDGTVEGSTFLGRIYRGYELSPKGSVIGLLWALPDGAIGGALFGLVYNLFVARDAGAHKSQVEV